MLLFDGNSVGWFKTRDYVNLFSCENGNNGLLFGYQTVN